MKKRLISGAVALMLLLSLCAGSVWAAEPFVEMQIDNPEALAYDETVTLDAPPVIVNDRTMVPLRFVAETLNCDVFWDGETATIFLLAGESVVTLQIGLEYALSAGGQIPLDAPPYIANDRTMVPLRFVAETFGIGVHWDEETRTIYLIEPGPMPPAE